MAAEIDLSSGTAPRKLDLKARPILAGEVSGKFVPATPFAWLKN